MTADLADLPLVLAVPEVAAALRVSKWSVYDAIQRGDLRAIRVGRSLRVPRHELAKLLDGSET